MRWVRAGETQRRPESAGWSGAKQDRVEQICANQGCGRQRHARQVRGKKSCRFAGLALLAAAFLMPNLSIAASAQNPRKEKKQPDTTGIVSPVPLPDTEAIDLDVSQMLGEWQVGNTAAMQKFYADDVVVVSGVWEQPVIGWNNYVKAYETQRARTKLARLERTNTYTKVYGDTAWVTYQWAFTGEVDGAAMSALGHTTLVLQKRDGKWLIVLNHTSIAPAPGQSDLSSSGIPKS